MKSLYLKLIALTGCFFLLTGASFFTPGPPPATFTPMLHQGADLSIPSNLHCDGAQVPMSVKQALQETLEFQKECRYMAGFHKRIAINDYSDASKPPTMYIFDSTGTQCLMKVGVAYGGAGRRLAPPQPCSGGGQKLTPPGIHLTASHNGKRYSGANAIGLVGMSGQNSVGRGVIMHPKGTPGSPSTWGCVGISTPDFQKVREMLGEGSIVNNYFGHKSAPSFCRSTAGLHAKGSSCHPDPGGASPQALIQSLPSARDYERMPMMRRSTPSTAVQ